MTIMIDPLETFEVILKRDKSKSANKQRKFVCQVLTARRWRKVVLLIDSLPTMTAVGAIDDIFKELSSIIVGWKGIKDKNGKEIQYKAELLMDILNQKEAIELLQEIVESNGLSDDDLKKSEWPSTPMPDASASNVTRQDVKVARTKKARSSSNAPSVTATENVPLAKEDISS